MQCLVTNKIYRFVNIVQNSRFDEKVIWNHIKTLRFEYLMKNSDLKCDKGFIPQENISNNFENLSHSAGVVKSSEHGNRTLSKTDINVAAEMGTVS